MSEEYRVIKEKIEQRLQEQQKSKEFKDIGRVSNTKKEKSAYRLISSDILNQLEQDGVMAFNMVKKDNVWPLIDVALEREKGTTAGAAYLKVKLREAVSTRPNDNAQMRASYVLFLELFQKDLQECFSIEQIRECIKTYDNWSNDKTIAAMLLPEYGLMSNSEQLAFKAKLSESREYRSVFMYSGNRLFRMLIKSVFSARFENALFIRSEASQAIWNEATAKEPVSEEEAEIQRQKLETRKLAGIQKSQEDIESYKQKTHQELMRAMETNWSIHSENKKLYKANPEAFRTWVLDYYKKQNERYISSMDERIKKMVKKDNDWTWFETPKEKDPNIVREAKERSINSKTPLSYIKRTGGYRVEANTPAEIINTFGFSAVNYGVYVDDKWSKDHTKHFLGGMTDLGEMINVNVKQINNLGKLAIAFGAKGRPGHLAAYFSQTKDINLTRGNGDGSLAHEWGHYLDNVIVELDRKVSTTQFASRGEMPDMEIAGLFQELMTFFKKGDILVTPKVPFRFPAKEQSSAPSFSVWKNGRWESQDVKIEATIEESLKHVDSIAVVSDRQYTTQLRVFGYIIAAHGLESYDIPLRLTTSYFYHKSAYKRFIYCFEEKPGQSKMVAMPRTNYWISEVELFARAWETVIMKKLMDKDRMSNYLVADIDTSDVIAEGYHVPYPTGTETAHIEKMIDKIVEAIKRKFSIGDFVSPSNVREDEYLELETSKKEKVETGIVIDKKPKAAPVVTFVEKDEVVAVVPAVEPAPIIEPTEESIPDLIEGLEVLLDTMEGQEKKDLQLIIDGLKLLI